jgi:hypothetical protein
MPGRLLLAGLIAVLLVQTAPAACPFCAAESVPTLVSQYRDSAMVLYGYFTNAKLDTTGGTDNGSSDFVIEKVLKPHDIVKGKKLVHLPKYVPPSKSKFIIFCDVYKDNINPFRGEEVTPGSELLEYLGKALDIHDAPAPKRLRYCFDFLNSPDLAVGTDAYREFAIADYADYKDMARSLPAKTIAQWLEDPKTPSFRLGLYASLLGHCGDPKTHGDLLRSMLNDHKKLQGANLDGLMAGYCMLQPKESWAYLQQLFKDGNEEFYLRYAGMKTLRFFWDYRNDVLDRKQIVQGMGLILDLSDLSDFAIEDLRNWKAWEMTDKVLDLFNKPSHDHPVIRRAILRFALSAPGKRSATFVQDQRKRDPMWVNDTEELLRIEAPEPKVTPDKKK